MKRITTGLLAAAMVFGTASASLAQGRIVRRQENQQDRVAQGVKNGTLQPGETARLESRESHLNNEIRTDRQANGGKLTPVEKAQVNRQQNRISGAIYRDKHN